MESVNAKTGLDTFLESQPEGAKALESIKRYFTADGQPISEFTDQTAIELRSMLRRLKELGRGSRTESTLGLIQLTQIIDSISNGGDVYAADFEKAFGLPVEVLSIVKSIIKYISAERPGYMIQPTWNESRREEWSRLLIEFKDKYRRSLDVFQA